MKFLRLAAFVCAALWFCIVNCTAQPPAIDNGARATALQLRREYTAAESADAQAAVVKKAVELGPDGVERMTPLVQADMTRALASYVNLFTQQVTRRADAAIEAIIAAHPALPKLRQRLLVIGQMWSMLQAAGEGEPFDPETQLRDRETQVIRELKLGPILSQLDEQELIALKLTNEQRAAAGLAPLVIDLKLCQTARDHSADMIKHGFFDHTSPVEGKATVADRGKRFGVIANGENIFAGNTSGAMAVEGWMNSEGHRANILNAGYRRVGFGRVEKHWTQVFGR